ncbi:MULTISPECIES: zinc-dependent alcohol dehydrogenase family protein [unclassified Afipia]|uniref:zinc-dependent alcohol dehydrogenase family protein n=1 Tax=unclassified Afipia TaxID=2642050 RepID=UPI001FCB84C1|nr:MULTISPECIES: zinc-dependent alcohol dehydrogenase family protein [unclassified Afipia]
MVVNAYGEPEEVVECVEVEDVGVPDGDEVVLHVLAFPINPADISFCRGRYRLKPPLPATPGAECVGRITAVGSFVSSVKVGDLVINLDRENWAQKRRVKSNRVVVLPAGIDPCQAAMLRINPPTARLLLEDFVELKEGDWVIQNAANSSVGQLAIKLARSRGIRTINVVRSEDAFPTLYKLGADVCLIDNGNLVAQVHDVLRGADLRLGIDAVAGSATARLASCLSPGATLCIYGSMSGDAITIAPSELVYRNIHMRGFILGRHLDVLSEDRIRSLYKEIIEDLDRFDFKIPIEQVYPIENIGRAIAHAQRSRHAGKILVAPNGSI